MTEIKNNPAIPWPNGLGWDVGEHEIWKLSGGYWGVRVFKNGFGWKSLKIHPESEMFPISKQDAVLLCMSRGDLILP